jgi:hypothetical protein
MKQLLIFAVALTTCGHSMAQEDVNRLLSESNPAIQAQLHAIYRVFRPVDGLSNNAEALREIQRLKQLSDDKAELVKQVAVFSMAPGPETQPMTAGAILYYLQIPSRDTIRALAPYLETENPQLRSFVRDWFRGLDNADSGPFLCVNYYHYLEYVRGQLNRNEEIPLPFIKYIYERSPGQALRVFRIASADPREHLRLLNESRERGQQGRAPTAQELQEIRQFKDERQQEGRKRRETLLAEHIISNALWLKKHEFNERFRAALPEAMAELEKLAQHEEWWARLYVVYIMRQNHALRNDKILRQLAEDENELVSQAAKGDKE